MCCPQSAAVGRARALARWLGQTLLISALVTQPCLAIVFGPPPGTTLKAGDLAPRGAPDGQLDAGDLVVMQRLLFGQLTPTAEERLAADVAPFNNPDAQLNAGDLVVLMRAIQGQLTLSDILKIPNPPLVDPLPGVTTDPSPIITGAALANHEVYLYVNGSLQNVTTAASDGRFALAPLLLEGPNALYLTAFNGLNESAPSATASLILDTAAPVLTLNSLRNGQAVAQAAQTLTGRINEPATLTINGIPVSVAADGSFSYAVTLVEGANTFTLTAVDAAQTNPTLTLTLYLDTVPPAAVAATQLTLTQPGAGTTTLSAAPASAEAGATVLVTNARSGATTTGTVLADGSFTLTLDTQGGDPLLVALRDAAGNPSAPTYQVAPGSAPLPVLQIITPTDGAVISDDRISVTGTLSAAFNTGIVINGQNASVHADRFFVNELALQPGINTLEASATDPDGNVVTASINVTSTAVTALSVSPEPAQGMAPLDVVWRINQTGNRRPVQIDIDLDSDGQIDISRSDFSTPLTTTYPAAGLYTATVTLTDDLANTRVSTYPISVLEPSQLDTGLRSVIYGLLNKLRAGDVAGANAYLSNAMQAKYQAAFQTALGSLPALVDRLGTLQGGAFGDDLARYVFIRDNNGQPTAYSVFLIKGHDGVWRVGEM